MPSSSSPNREYALSEEEAAEARRLFEALQAFRDEYSDMTVAQAAALLLAASANEPLSMSGIRSSLDVAASTATRAVLTLSKVGPGASQNEESGLIAQTVDPKDRRWRFAHCTPSGIRTVRRALSKLRPLDPEK